MSILARGSLERSASWEDSNTHPHLSTTSPAPQSLSAALYARRAEFTRSHTIKVKIGTWNVAACSGVDNDIGAWFVEGKGIDKRLSGFHLDDRHRNNHAQEHAQPHEVESIDSQEIRASRSIKKLSSTVPKHDEAVITGGEEIGLYVLGLQEIVDLSAAREYIGKLYSDDAPSKKWQKALERAMPRGYTLVSEQQLSGLLLLIYASPQIAPTVSSVSSVPVGTGVMGYLGNKGAVTTRIVLGETTKLVFINSHLASGTDDTHLDRRCWDVQQILARTKFDPICRAGVLDDQVESIGDEDFAFWFGDLNFRLVDLPGADIRHLLMLHTRGEYGHGTKSQKHIDKELSHYKGSASTIDTRDSRSFFSNDSSIGTAASSLPDPDDFDEPSNPHEDPTSLQATLDSLLPHDQLMQVKKARKAFHDGWREGPITFLPTYRYDVGSMGMYDSSEKKRTPSWCDRILFRTRRDKLSFEGKSQERELARLKDQDMQARGMEKASEDDDILYDYDPESDGDETNDKTIASTRDDNDYDESEDNEQEALETVTEAGYIDSISLDTYTSHQRVLSSDHKPVDAVFTLTYDAVVPELRATVQQEIARDFDRAENEGRPNITVVVDHSHDMAEPLMRDTHTSGSHNHKEADDGVDFGHVSFLRQKVRYLTIANTGQSSARCAFMTRPIVEGGSESITPQWLTLQQALHQDQSLSHSSDLDRELTLEPGDAINISLCISISAFSQARSLNKSETKLDDVLVLRVANGRDHFIPVRAHWLQTCFAKTIDDLIRIPEGGVRALSQGQPTNEVKWSAPRELFKLTEATELLMERTFAEREMIPAESSFPESATGWPFDSSTWTIKDAHVRRSLRDGLLEALDCDDVLLESFVHDVPAFQRLEIVAETLLLFLASMPDGIITADLWSMIDQGLEQWRKNSAGQMSSEAEKSNILDIISSSPHHNISLVFLTAMLGKLASDIAPVSAKTVNSSSSSSIASAATSARMSLDQTLRRSLSFKSGKTATPSTPSTSLVHLGHGADALKRRQAVNRRFAEIFAPVICRSVNVGSTLGERVKKSIEDRQVRVIEVFLDASMEQSIGQVHGVQKA